MTTTRYVCLLAIIASFGSRLFAQNLTTLVSFSGANGSNPQSALTEVYPGIFVGSTAISNVGDAGTLFRISNTGVLTSLLIFDANQQGTLPTGQLFPASNGYLYGANQGAGPSQGGTIFKTAGNRSLTVVATAVNSPSPVVEASDGNIYFTSYTAGGLLTVVRMTLAGALTTLYTFPSGLLQSGPLVEAYDGNLYGEVQGLAPGFGAIFKLTLAGDYTTLYNFTGADDGAQPLGGLIQVNKVLYGVTNSAGANGDGTIFSISTAGVLTTLHAFSYYDGTNPLSGLSYASDGNIYGTNAGIGGYGPGTIFKIAPDGSNFTTVYTFPANNPSFTQVPGPGVIQGSDGKLYGTTLLGGADNLGQIFSLDLGLAGPSPLVGHISPSAGPVGTQVLITGRNLVGVQSVSFNGTAATTFVSQGTDYILATVPAGARSGPVSVTTLNGTGATRGNFRVN